uniref:Putative ASX n=1 Tax=Reticulitermes speratus TaxID=60591 RepID=A0A347ZJG1_9NEOP
MVMEVDEDSHRNCQDINEACKNHDKVECGLADRRMDTMPGCSYDSLKDLNSRISHSHSKKVIKHALRQQAKRRRKNTTIASGNSAPLPRIVVKSLSVLLEDKEFKDTFNSASPKPATMREVLASIPGFSIKPRKRSTKKLSTAAQLEQTKEGCIDLETPDSILVNTNLRALLNKHTFSSLPPLYQYKLVQLLPDVDRAGVAGQPDASFRLSTSGLNNEFFARACLEWRERLAEGEFTPENQQKLKAEAEKEMSRLDPWKLKHFEPIWGERHEPTSDSTPLLLPSPARPSLKTTIKLRPSTSASIRHSKIVPRRPRTVGAVTRAITNYWVQEEADSTADKPPSPAEKRPADRSDRIGEGKEMHKKLKAVSSSAEESSPDVGMVHSVNIEECVPGNGIRSERAENSVGDEALAYETDVTVFKSETDMEAAAAESSVDCESEQIAARESVVHETDAAECKSEEHVTPESAECEMNVVTCTVKEEDVGIDKETEDEHVTSEVDTSMKCESKKQQGESGNWDSVERNFDLRLDYDTPSDIRPALSNVEVLLKCETEEAATEIDSVASNIRNTVDQELDLVQEMAVSVADHMTYEPDMVPGHDVIHESAILDSSGYIINGDSVVQTNSNSKEDDTKTAVDVSGEVESVSGLEDLKVEEEEDPAEVHAALIAAVTGSEGCCWDVDSTEKLLDKVPLAEVPLVAVPVALALVEERDVEVIPMQEELEVILKPSNFPVAPEDALSMDSAIVTAALDDIGGGTSSTVKSTQAQYPEYSTSQAVKLELEG